MTTSLTGSRVGSQTSASSRNVATSTTTGYGQSPMFHADVGQKFGTSCTSPLRSDDDCTQLSISFATFFVEKIRRIKVTNCSRLGNSFEDPLQCDVRHPTQMFTDITLPSTDKIQKLIRLMPAESSPLNKIPTSVIKTCADVFAPLIA